MTIQADEYKSSIGLDSLYVAEILQDNAAGYSADTPVYLAPAAEATSTPATNQETQYADDGPYDVFVGEGETTINMVVTGIPPETLALITGNVFDASTGRIYDYGGTPPEMALMFRSLKSNGSYRYFSFLKGRFSMPADKFSTKGDTPTPQTVEITFTAVRTIYAFDLDGGTTYKPVKRVWGDEDTTDFDATGWFTQVQTPAVASPSALALSSSTPTDDLTDVAITTNVTLTFNNILATGAENGCVLIDGATLLPVAAAVSIDSTRKIVTVNPTASLDNSADYSVIIGVSDIYGQTLTDEVSFTTVAL